MSQAMTEVRGWILKKHPELDGEIDPDTDLIESRLIDSLSFTEFVMLVGVLSGEPIEPSTLSIDDFRTLNAIEKRYFE